MRVRLAEILLVVAAIGLAWMAAEAAFSLIGLRYLPLRLHDDLPEDVRVFAQSSKAGVLPRDPIVLMGDSYAQGFGDWLLAADPDGNGPFHSAHVIQRISGRDVVTLGVSGAGSAEGIAAFPAIAYAQANHAWYLRLPAPSVAVVYFYEGNDLNNNAMFLQRRVEHLEAPGLAERVERSLASYPAALSVGPRGWGHFPLLGFSKHVVQRIYAERTATAAPAAPEGTQDGDPTDPQNSAEIAGKRVPLPANLQSPSLELTRPELERSVVVYERSLAFLRKLLPGTPVLVVYLPSPLSIYRLAGAEVSIQRYVAHRASRYPKERVAEYSDAMCGLIRSATIANGAGFLDTRAALRAAGERELVHGPREFKHFNRKGMEVLGQAVAERIDQPLAQGPCS